MSPEPKALDPLPTPALVVEPPPRKRFGWLAAMAVLVVVAAAGTWASGSGKSIRGLFVEEEKPLPLFEVDEGSLVVYLVETGALESANNTSIKCQVESLLGTTGGTAGTGRTGSTGSSTTSTSPGGAAAYGAASTTGASTGTSSASSTKKAGSASKKGSTATANSKAMPSGTASGGASASGGAAGGTASGGASASSGSTGTTTTTSIQRPTVRSFSYDIPKYVPLRGTAKTAQAKANTTAAVATGGGGGGGGGRGGRGGGGGGRGGGGGAGGMDQEKAGSTRIIWLKPEGSPVKKDEVVCELDSAAFKDELQAQRIRWLQAKSWVDQAREIYEFNLLLDKEYREGIYPQDTQVIRQWIQACETDYERAQRTEAWSREVYEKRYRATAQYEADRVTVEQTALALKEARGMQERLEKFTGPRLIKSIASKLESIKSDWLAQQAAFGIEDDRLHRLEKMIANCTIKAPADGVLVYNNQSNAWSGQVEVQIQEGATVREGQTLFDLPDPTRMRVKVKVNESKMASVHPGQRAEVQIEAFPGRPLKGTVAEITPIPAVQNRFSDIKIYFATVNIDQGFEGLRPGMSAEVTFLVDTQPKVTRVPVAALRWVSGQSFVAVAARIDGETRWDWRPVTVGLIDPNFAEIVKGLTPGEKVVASPESLLPAPDPARSPPGPRTASATGPPTHDG